MAYKMIDRVYSSEADGYIATFVLDSESDVASLPQSTAGSTAIVAASGGGVYMVNASGEWKEQ